MKIQQAMYAQGRRLGLIQVQVDVLSVQNIIDAFHAIEFLPLDSVYRVASNTIHYTGYCATFDEVPLGHTIPVYMIITHPHEDEHTTYSTTRIGA